MGSSTSASAQAPTTQPGTWRKAETRGRPQRPDEASLPVSFSTTRLARGSHLRSTTQILEQREEKEEGRRNRMSTPTNSLILLPPSDVNDKSNNVNNCKCEAMKRAGKRMGRSPPTTEPRSVARTLAGSPLATDWEQQPTWGWDEVTWTPLLLVSQPPLGCGVWLWLWWLWPCSQILLPHSVSPALSLTNAGPAGNASPSVLAGSVEPAHPIHPARQPFNGMDDSLIAWPRLRRQQIGSIVCAPALPRVPFPRPHPRVLHAATSSSSPPLQASTPRFLFSFCFLFLLSFTFLFSCIFRAFLLWRCLIRDRDRDVAHSLIHWWNCVKLTFLGYCILSFILFFLFSTDRERERCAWVFFTALSYLHFSFLFYFFRLPLWHVMWSCLSPTCFACRPVVMTVLYSSSLADIMDACVFFKCLCMLVFSFVFFFFFYFVFFVWYAVVWCTGKIK